MTDCIFCKIAAGEIPSTRVYEDDLCVAFLDISPITPGHALVIPRAHHSGVTSTPDDLAAHLLNVAQRVARAQKTALGAEGVNIFTNEGQIAGQSVFHTHFHVIPQYASAPHRWNFDSTPYPSPDVPAALAARLSAALA
ncbi:MAG: HIT family protein [Kiritimatiellae bacterium]|nr:HIT family protein [Kiritimatiellia bacterium]